MKPICLIGYSGHSYVVADAVSTMGFQVSNYCDKKENLLNPLNLIFSGDENHAIIEGIFNNLFPVLGIGDNILRARIANFLISNKITVLTVLHQKAIIASGVEIKEGSVVLAGAILNPFVSIGTGVICNSGCIIEHECKIGDFSHICPGAVLAGNVTVGKNVFIGANSVIRQGIIIGDNVVVGAGSVVVKNIKSDSVVYGVPAK